MGPNGQPFDKIRAYFGEKISLFFEFRAHLTSWLLWPALLGFALECVVVATYDFSHPVIPFFALLIAVWSVLMTEFWKRREISVAMEAGMVGFEVSIQDRPEYKVSSCLVHRFRRESALNRAVKLSLHSSKSSCTPL
jgi:hypothetical protein